jgi:predicted lipoprotein with Yx(FWY)xxD motif
MENDNSYSNTGYGKRPLWQWIILYIIIGAIIYAGGYYFFISKKGGYASASNYVPNTIPMTSPTLANPPTATTGVILTKNDQIKGNYLTDLNGMMLYIWDNDKNGTSNCTGKCLTNWPPFLESAMTATSLPTGLSVITRTDNKAKQYAWNGKPLYYFIQDKAVGDLKGDGINNIWHLVKP